MREQKNDTSLNVYHREAVPARLSDIPETHIDMIGENKGSLRHTSGSWRKGASRKSDITIIIERSCPSLQQRALAVKRESWNPMKYNLISTYDICRNLTCSVS